MNRPIPYKGNKPYIFVSYAHKDSDRVWPIIARMQEDNYYIWYDEGITPGMEWADYIDTSLCGCYYFLAFLSKNYLASDNCKDELNRSRDVGIKNRLLIYLENVSLEGGMALRNNRVQAVLWYQYESEEECFSKLYTAANLENCRRQGPFSLFGDAVAGRSAEGRKPGLLGGIRKGQQEDPDERTEGRDESERTVQREEEDGETVYSCVLSSETEEEAFSGELLSGKNTFILTDPDCEDRTYQAALSEEEPVLIGRSRKENCQIVLSGAKAVSRRHCMVCLKDGRAMVSDLGSTNGTYLNGQPVTEETQIRAGDVLRIGGLNLAVEIRREEDLYDLS